MMLQTGQATAGHVGWVAPTVVYNLDAHVVLDLDGHRQSSSTRVPDSVAEGFAHNGFNMNGQCIIDNRQGAHELNRAT